MMPKHILSMMAALLALVQIALAQPALAADAPTTVNGQPLKQSLIDFILKDAAEHGQKADDELKSNVINKLISQELVYQEAVKAGVEKQADFQAKQELMRRELVINTYLQDYLKKNPISDAIAKAEYDKVKAQAGDKEYSARHILVKTEQEAKDIIAQLAKGGDFAALAKSKSLDPGSKERGGDLGWFAPAGMVAPFANAVTKLQKGSYTQAPVQTQFGWHVIKLEDVRSLQPPPFENVKEEIGKKLQQRQLEKLVTDLRAKAKIVDGSAKK